MLKTYLASLGLAALLSAVPFAYASAVDVVNEDETDYTLIVNDGDREQEVLIGSGVRLEDVCTSCTIEVEGVGEIEADEMDVVHIRGGELELGD